MLVELQSCISLQQVEFFMTTFRNMPGTFLIPLKAVNEANHGLRQDENFKKNARYNYRLDEIRQSEQYPTIHHI